MTTLTDRLDAVCIKLGITNKEGIERAIESFVRNNEECERLENGCGAEHECSFCDAKFKCYYFCGQSMYRECKLCNIKRAKGELIPR